MSLSYLTDADLGVILHSTSDEIGIRLKRMREFISLDARAWARLAKLHTVSGQSEPEGISRGVRLLIADLKMGTKREHGTRTFEEFLPLIYKIVRYEEDGVTPVIDRSRQYDSVSELIGDLENSTEASVHR